MIASGTGPLIAAFTPQPFSPACYGQLHTGGGLSGGGGYKRLREVTRAKHTGPVLYQSYASPTFVSYL